MLFRQICQIRPRPGACPLMSVCLSVCLSVYVCVSVCLCVCMYVCLSVCYFLSHMSYLGKKSKMLKKTFIDFDIRHRMSPLRKFKSITLTYKFKDECNSVLLMSDLRIDYSVGVKCLHMCANCRAAQKYMYANVWCSVYRLDTRCAQSLNKCFWFHPVQSVICIPADFSFSFSLYTKTFIILW